MLNLLKKIFQRGEVDCKEVRKLASGYLDEDLPPPKYSAIHAHLSRCGPCRAFIDTLAATIGVLARLPPLLAPPSPKQSILERTRKMAEGKSSELGT